jgi:hypothetical protein
MLSICTGCGSGSQEASPPIDASGLDASGLDASEIDASEIDAPGDAPGPSDAEADAPGCTQSAGPAPAGAARSAGFSGKDSDFIALFNVPCGTPADCTAPCVTAGGTMASCASSSLCLSDPVADGGLRCIPPAYWLKTSDALSDSDADTGAAEVVLVDTPYHDALLLTDFHLSVPVDATVVGIQFDLERDSLEGETVDVAVQVLQNGIPVGADHSLANAWPQALTSTTFGGKSDTWGVSWTPADVNASGFGLAVTPKITATKGNDRAHIDSVRATVFYSDRCD